MEPAISIVTPSFQQAPFLRACIDSVLTQDYPNLEYIVQDGASTDGSLAILCSYGDRFAWSSHPDEGQAAAINVGVRESHGEILGYLNSDDVLLPGALRTVAESFARHPEVDVIYGKAEIIDATGRVTGRYQTRPFEPESFFGDCYLCQPATFWRRRVMDRIGLFDESLDSAMDYEYWIRIARSGGRFLYIDAHLAQSRDYPQTKTRSNRAGAFRDIFYLSRRHLGSIHPRWIESYLYHVRHETHCWWRHLIASTEAGRRPLVKLIQIATRRWRRAGRPLKD